MQIRNDTIELTLDPKWPRIVRISRNSDQVSVAGCDPAAAFELEIDGRRFGEAAMAVVASEQTDVAEYRVTIAALDMDLVFRFALEGSEVVLTIPGVLERGAYRVQRLFVPRHRLVTASAAQGFSFLRHITRRTNRSRNWCPGTATYDQWEDSGRVADANPEPGPQLTNHACVWAGPLCIAIKCSIRVEPLVSELSADPEKPGRAGAFSISAGRWAYRLRGEVAEPLEVRITMLGDYNGNGKVDCFDAAAWEGDRTFKPDPRYHEVIVYKLTLDLPGTPRPVRSFADCLTDIKAMNEISGGMKQIVYLVGWQHTGHDTGYPSHAQVNERVGGLEALLKLIEDARVYNCIVSLHGNIDDAYAEFPEYREDLLSRDGDRRLVWFHNGLTGMNVYSINHTLCVESGYQQDRMERLLKMLPIRESIHFDAHRPYNEVYGEGGVEIDAECEVQRGMLPTKRMYAERGVDITTEDSDVEKRGLYSWVWIRPNWLLRYATAMYHGRIGGMWRAGIRSGRGGLEPCAEGAALGMAFFRTEGNTDTFASMQRCFYLYWMYAKLLERKRMLEYRTGDWNNGVQAWYSDDTRVHGAGSSVEAWYEGIPVARDESRFLPWREDTVYSYSVAGGEETWMLPRGWEGHTVCAEPLNAAVKAEDLRIRIDGRAITLIAPAEVPVRFVRG